MKRASIDIGSNTTLLLLAEFDGKAWNELANETEVTSLGRGLDKEKKFHPESMQATYQALEKYSKIIKNHGIDFKEVIVTATEASRVATNSKEFFAKIKSELNLDITIINAEGEAYYTAFGVCEFSKLPENVTIMDIGGASTELIFVRSHPLEVIKTISLPVGSVRCTEWLENDEFESKMNKILSDDRISDFKTSHLICVAGSMTSLGNMIKGNKEFKAESVDKTQIEMSKFKYFLNKLIAKKTDEIASEFPFLGKRAKTIKAGALLGMALGERLKVNTFEISTRGLRYGTLFSGRIKNEFKQL